MYRREHGVDLYAKTIFKQFVMEPRRGLAPSPEKEINWRLMFLSSQVTFHLNLAYGASPTWTKIAKGVGVRVA